MLYALHNGEVKAWTQDCMNLIQPADNFACECGVNDCRPSAIGVVEH